MSYTNFKVDGLIVEFLGSFKSQQNCIGSFVVCVDRFLGRVIWHPLRLLTGALFSLYGEFALFPY